MSDASVQPRLPLAVKAAYGLADMGINVFVIFKGLLVFAFLVQFSGVDPALAGWVTSAVLVIDVITDPLMGWLSDRTGGRFGRRHPYIISGAVLMAVLMIVTFAVFILGSMVSQFFWVTLSKTIGKQATLMFGIVFYGVVLVGFYFVLPSSEGLAIGVTNLGLITVFVFLIGAANGCYQQLPWSMMPDLVDWSVERESFNIAGSFSGLWLLGQKVGNALAPLVFGQLLALYGWISSTNGGDVTQLPEAVDALRWALTLIPAALMFISVPLYLLFDGMAKRSQR